MRQKTIISVILLPLLFIVGYTGDLKKPVLSPLHPVFPSHPDRFRSEINLTSLPVGRAPTEIIISGSQAYVACFGDESVWVVDLESKTNTNVLYTGPLPGALSRSPDGKYVFVSGYETSLGVPFPGDDCSTLVIDSQAGRLTVINTLSNTVEAAILLPHNPPYVTLPSTDGKKLFTVTWNGIITVIDLTAFVVEELYYIDAGRAEQAALSPDGRLLYISTEFISNEIIVFDVVNRSMRSISFDGTGCELTNGFRMVVDPSGQYLFTNGYYQSGPAAIVFSLSTETVVKQIPGHFGSLTFSRDGGKAYLLSSEYPSDHGVQFDLNSLEIENNLPTGGVSAVLSIDGSRLYVTRYGGPYRRRVEMEKDYPFKYEITVLNLEQNIASENKISQDDIWCSYSREITASGDGRHIIASNSALNSVTFTDFSDIRAPLNFSGSRQANRSFFMTEYIDVLSWQENPYNQNISKYRLYTISDGERGLLAEVDAAIFEYRHRNVGKDEECIYSVAAVNDKGEEGIPAYVSVR